MLSLRIPIHSFIDVITNSSTTVYIRASESSIKAIKELIDTILSLGGSDKKADDLFEFKIGLGKREEKHAINIYMCDNPEIGNYDEALIKFYKDIESGKIKFEDYEDGEYPSSNALIITSKEDNILSIDLIAKIKSIFYVDGYRDG